MEGLSPGLSVGASLEPPTPSKTALAAKKQKSKRAVSQESKVSATEAGGNDYEESKERASA